MLTGERKKTYEGSSSTGVGEVRRNLRIAGRLITNHRVGVDAGWRCDIGEQLRPCVNSTVKLYASFSASQKSLRRPSSIALP
jgi:hypothetical protein